jgi:hypothetical protein
MSLSHSLVTLSTTAQIISIAAEDEIPYANELSISVQNTDASIVVYLGGTGVTSSSYGYKLLPGTVFTADISPNDELYAVAASGTPNVAIIKVQHNG